MKIFNVGIKSVIVKNGKVLLVKNATARVGWEVPGGRIDGNETTEQALKRELKEELPNIKNTQIGRILSAHRVQRDIAPNTSLVLVFYEVKADFDGEPMLSDEHEEVRWATKKEALKLANESCQEAIKRAL